MYLLKKLMIIVVGSTFVSLGINLFLVPHEVLDGGIIGIGLILNYLWGLKVGLTIILLSIPIFIIAWCYYRDYFYSSLHGMIISSFIIDLLKQSAPLFEMKPVYSAALGGILIGIGIGLMLRYKASTGGTDLIAQFISDKTGLNVGILVFIIDASVLLLGGILLSSNIVFLSAITIFFAALMTTILNKNIA